MKFADPPEKHQRRMKFDWDVIYASLRENPGQWAVLAEPGYMSTYNAIRQSSISNFLPMMGIELRIANSDYKAKPRTCDLYARYNPDRDAHLTVKEREKMWREIRRTEKEKQMTVTTVGTEEG